MPGNSKEPPFVFHSGLPTPSPAPSLTVIVVSYNTVDALRRCLASLAADHSAGVVTEVVVVDNASHDDSVAMVRQEFPWVRLIANDRNAGFGVANNQALDSVATDFALLLNPDALARPGAVARLLEVAAEPGVVAVGGKLVDPGTERPQNSCANELTLWAVFCEQTLLEKAFPRNPVLAPYWTTRAILSTGSSEPRPVGQVQGACLLFRPLERFDEDYFLYVEDTDLCRKLRRHGRILYVPDAVFEHELGASSTGNRWMSVARYNRGKELYFLKHHGPAAMAACFVMDRFGALMRLFGYLALSLVKPGRGWQGVTLFARVLSAPFRGPAMPRDAQP
ncbi:MAG: glycosyltransferase family 2 protein [Fimbriimonadaceae bacterium]|nr:glycosyltransferase family 2 protein [Fimbriimonadaceae bacterium]QYK57162.1 MAG: glycosyltransferase family 2 protein [Fimbriimonadaceae bacterium]